MISRIAGEALINASDIDVANESIHDRSVELFFEAAQRLNRMGGFVRRTGGAIKVAARKIQETDDLLVREEVLLYTVKGFTPIVARNVSVRVT